MTTAVRIVRPSDVRGYHKLMQAIDELLPWSNATTRELRSKLTPDDAAQVETYARTMRAYIENDLYFAARMAFLTGDRPYPVSGVVESEGPKLRMLDHDYLFKHYRALEKLLKTKGADGMPMLHRLWMYHFRAGYKTTSIQDLVKQAVCRNPNIRISYYSKVRDPMAVARADGIRLEFEHNKLLQVLYPDTFWQDEPRREAAQAGVLWSNKAFTVKRSKHGLTMTEPTVSTAGLLRGGGYTGGHPDWRIVDDPVDRENASGDMADKTYQLLIDAFKIADPTYEPLDIVIGTQWGRNDPYVRWANAGFIRRTWTQDSLNAKVECEETEDLGGGAPVFLTPSALRGFLGGQAPKTTDAHYQEQQPEFDGITLQESKVKGTSGEAWEDFIKQYRPGNLGLAERKPMDSGLIGTYSEKPGDVARRGLVVIIMDPGGTPGVNAVKAKTDDTAIFAVACLAPRNYFLVDGVMDILHPQERARWVVNLHKKLTMAWGCKVQQVRVEGAGNADVPMICEVQDRESYYFEVTRIKRGGKGTKSKIDRVYSALEPVLSDGRMFFPPSLASKRRGARIDLVPVLKDKIDAFGTTPRADGPDCLALLEETQSPNIDLYHGGRAPRAEKLRALQFPSAPTGQYKTDRPRPKQPQLGGMFSGALAGIPLSAYNREVA